MLSSSLKRARLVVALIAALAATGLSACGGDDGDGGGAATSAGEVSGSIEVVAEWTGAEQEGFEAVLDGFTERYPDVEVSYTSAGAELRTVLTTAVAGGSPPDVAAVPNPGLIEQFVRDDALTPLDFAREEIEAGFGAPWIEAGSVGGELYGLFFKGANKSTGWYSVPAFEAAGVEPPETWEDLTAAAETLKASGTPAYSIAGADGWTLTDLFENIYLRSAGAEKYRQLAANEIPWTDESVKTALTLMAEVFADPENIAGGTRGALQTGFDKSVTQVFTDPPAAAMLFEADFVQGVIADETAAEPGTGFDVFPFPSIEGSPQVVVGAGDAFVVFRSSPAAEALIDYLATAEAASLWAERGGFSSPNRDLDTSVYPDEIAARMAADLAGAEEFVFDLSDLQPVEFGGTDGAGMYRQFQALLQDPAAVDQVAARLERDAQRAHGGR